MCMMRNGITACGRAMYYSECSELRHLRRVSRINFGHANYSIPLESLRSSVTRSRITSLAINSCRGYGTSQDSKESPPFDSTGRDSQIYSNEFWLQKIVRRLFLRGNTASGPWETRRTAGVPQGYEPDTEWESLQLLSNLIRKVKTEVSPGEETSELHDIEFQLKTAVDDLLPRLAKEELPVVHVRLIDEAWKILYTPKIGNFADSDETVIIRSADIPRQRFNREELNKLLQHIVRYEHSSQYHVELGRKVFQELMRMTTGQKEAQEQFMLFVLLLSRNKADKEMLIAYNELLRILQSVDENMAVSLVSIINNVSDEKVQEVLVSRLFCTNCLDIGAFNVILQAAIENEQRNIWAIYNQVVLHAEETNMLLHPNLDTYELLFRYVVKDYEAEQSVSFMAHAKEVLFDESQVPAFEVIDNQALYRSYLTACIVSGDTASAARIASFFKDDELLPHLDGETWRVLAQWVTYRSQEVSRINELLREMNSYGYGTDIATLNGIMRASQFGTSAEDFRNAVFGLYELYNVKLDTNAVGMRIRDRVRSGKPLQAVAVFKRGVNEGLTWDLKIDDMKALFVMLEGLAAAENFDPEVLVEMYVAVRLYVSSVDYPTRLAMAKTFVDHGEVGNLRDLLKEEMGDSYYKYLPDAFPELYDLLHRAVLDTYTGDAAWMLYGCIHSHFIPSYESYLPIMRHFCELDYCEAALELFRHVRKGTDTPPQKDMYTLAFRQFARRNFVSGINELFHCYKVDLNIDPDIELFNAMLEACSPSSHDYLSYTLWQQIRLNAAAHPTEVIHQPNTETLRLLLKVASHTGAGYADLLWEEFEKYSVPLTAEHFKYYIAAHCEANNFDKAFQIATRMFDLALPEPEPDSSEDISATVGDAISVLYNYIESEDMRKQVEEWATLVHPQEWKKVKRIGPLMQRLDIRGYNIFSNPLEQARLEKVRQGMLASSQEYSGSRPMTRAELPKASEA
ncbi:hypothetical protein V1506DRAFT_537508 [Lipomyces tetrasporus]